MIDVKPTLLLSWLLLVGAYMYVVGPLGRRYGKTTGRSQIAAFTGGAFLLLASLQSPLDYLAGRYLFSAHMLQHMIMVFAAAPLLVMGLPAWFLRPIVRQRTVWPAAQVLTHPVVSILGFHAVFTLYHFPSFYVSSLASEPLHALMHILFLGTAMLAWWPIVSPLPDLPRLSYPVQMLFLAAQTVLSQPVGAIIALADVPLYAPYVEAPRILGLTALEDQQVGGLMMWVGGALYYFCVLTVIFFRWALRAEAEAGAQA